MRLVLLQVGGGGRGGAVSPASCFEKAFSCQRAVSRAAVAARPRARPASTPWSAPEEAEVAARVGGRLAGRRFPNFQPWTGSRERT